MTSSTKEDDQRFVTKLINPLGETRWQPTLPNGVRAWKDHRVRGNVWACRGDVEEEISDGPRLYRSRARAARVARRRWVKAVENQWKEA